MRWRHQQNADTSCLFKFDVRWHHLYSFSHCENKISCSLLRTAPWIVLPWEVGVVVAVVMGGLPLLCADWLVVEAEVVAGEVRGRWPVALVMAARRPSGFVPYCTGWNNLHPNSNITISIYTYKIFQNIRGSRRHHVMLHRCLEKDFIADLMGFIGHCLGRGGGSGPV